jgi:hypothetical protein
MFVNKDSVIINDISMGKYLLQADYEYNKLWASDSGRNLAGEQTGTLIGIFPKLVLQFRKLTKDEVHLLAPILDSARQTVQYYDDNKGAMITMTTYTGDWKIVNKGIEQNEPFSCSFISTRKRS